MMKTGTVQLGNASLHIGYTQIIPPTKRGLAREITEFYVPDRHRNLGEGTRLLEEVCGQADDGNIILILMADTVKLKEFYEKFGFKMIQDGNNILMARQPKGESNE